MDRPSASRPVPRRPRVLRTHPPSRQVAAELHPHLPTWEVLSERVLRAQEANEGELIGSIKIGQLPGGRAALHRPDLALRSGSRVVVVEVELTVKAPRRLAVICQAYARARHIHHNIYLTTPAAARAVQRAIQQTRAQDRITILALNDLARLAVSVDAGS
jgi:hypothetical protein